MSLDMFPDEVINALMKHVDEMVECECEKCTQKVHPDEYTFPECLRCYAGCE